MRRIVMFLAVLAWGGEMPRAAADMDPATADLDKDGIPDELEDQLLERFRPLFHFSRTDCDVLPSEFQAGAPKPKSVERNGTIYGQVFPVTPAGRSGAFLEVHFHHLWRQDCGRAGHALDAEHVSALLTAPAAGAAAAEWKAVYWYAAAHEGTVCDAGNGGRAEALNAERRGPHVWVSHGKHASYLSLDLCRVKGCGGDRCRDMVVPGAGPLINLGEWQAPRNGATWVHGEGWEMESKFLTDFTAARLVEFAALDARAAAPVNGSVAPVKAVMLAGGETLGALETGGRHTNQALETADRHTGTALTKAAASTGKSLKKAAGAVAGALGVK